MNITKHDIDSLNAEITITVSPADYELRVNEGIKKVQRQANMPGFRPGKVPSGIIKKQYGTQIMADEINKMLNDSIYKYIEENKIEILGQPMPKEQASVDFSSQKDFEFVYQLGLVPGFEVPLNSNSTFTYKLVKVDDELIEKYIKDVRRNFGKQINPDVTGENDIIFVDINELDETGSIKAGGIYKSTSVTYTSTNNENARAKLLGVMRNDKVVLNINELYESAHNKIASLGIDSDLAETINCNIQLTVRNISRIEDAELNQELFDRVYDKEGVNSEEEFRNKIRGELALMFRADSEKFLMREVENKMIEMLNLQLPDSFLKRWLIAVNEKPVTPEELEKDYPNYAKAMQWRLIENKIIKQNGITVAPEEAEEEARGFVKGQYARYGQAPGEEDLEKITKDLMKNEKEAQKIFENLYSKKVLALIKEKCTLQPLEVSYDEFFKNN